MFVVSAALTTVGRRSSCQQKLHVQRRDRNCPRLRCRIDGSANAASAQWRNEQWEPPMCELPTCWADMRCVWSNNLWTTVSQSNSARVPIRCTVKEEIFVVAKLLEISVLFWCRRKNCFSPWGYFSPLWSYILNFMFKLFENLKKSDATFVRMRSSNHLRDSKMSKKGTLLRRI